MIAWFSVFLICILASAASAQTVVATAVSEDATEAASESKIARDSRGAVHVTFVKPAGGVDQVYVASSTDGGRTWRTQQVTSRRFPSRYPTLAAGPDSTLHLAWTTYEPIGHIYYSRFDGTRWSAPVKVSPGDAYAGVPAIAADARNDPHIVWYGIRDQAPPVTTRHGSIYEILYSGRSGGRWSAPVIISPGIPDSINPALAIDAEGTLHSAWYQFDIEAYQVQHTRRLREWEVPRQVSSGDADAFGVALAVREDGRVSRPRGSRISAMSVPFDLLGRRPGRRAMVVFTDGDDKVSHASVSSVVRRVESHDATLYLVGQGQAASCYGVLLDAADGEATRGLWLPAGWFGVQGCRRPRGFG